MTPKCCPCNGSGRCKNCGCVRRGSPCVDCYVGEVRCQNRTLLGATRNSSQPPPRLSSTQRRVQLTTSSQPVTDGTADLPKPKVLLELVSSRPLLEQTTRPLPCATKVSHLDSHDMDDDIAAAELEDAGADDIDVAAA